MVKLQQEMLFCKTLTKSVTGKTGVQQQGCCNTDQDTDMEVDPAAKQNSRLITQPKLRDRIQLVCSSAVRCLHSGCTATAMVTCIIGLVGATVSEAV